MVASEHTLFTTLNRVNKKILTNIDNSYEFHGFLNKTDKKVLIFSTNSVIFFGYIFVVTCCIISSNIAY